MKAEPVTRVRLTYIALALVTIAVGLLVHEQGAGLGLIARDVLSDALWATMIAWWVGAIVPGARLVVRSGAAYAICAGVQRRLGYVFAWTRISSLDTPRRNGSSRKRSDKH